MTRLILLIILGFVTALYFPESRAAMAERAAPILTPAFRWQTTQEMNRVARAVQNYERDTYGQLPDARRFHTWLGAQFGEGGTVDAWDNLYQIVAMRDSFAIVSWGPDGVPDTEDDLRVARSRARAAR